MYYSSIKAFSLEQRNDGSRSSNEVVAKEVAEGVE